VLSAELADTMLEAGRRPRLVSLLQGFHLHALSRDEIGLWHGMAAERWRRRQMALRN